MKSKTFGFGLFVLSLAAVGSNAAFRGIQDKSEDVVPVGSTFSEKTSLRVKALTQNINQRALSAMPYKKPGIPCPGTVEMKEEKRLGVGSRKLGGPIYGYTTVDEPYVTGGYEEPALAGGDYGDVYGTNGGDDDDDVGAYGKKAGKKGQGDNSWYGDDDDDDDDGYGKYGGKKGDDDDSYGNSWYGKDDGGGGYGKAGKKGQDDYGCLGDTDDYGHVYQRGYVGDNDVRNNEFGYGFGWKGDDDDDDDDGYNEYHGGDDDDDDDDDDGHFMTPKPTLSPADPSRCTIIIEPIAQFGFPQCNVCGEGKVMRNPDAELGEIRFGDFTASVSCGCADLAGQLGYIPACGYVQAQIADARVCDCGP
jgi:hypothetical protein